jgi:hypothetical protein
MLFTEYASNSTLTISQIAKNKAFSLSGFSLCSPVNEEVQLRLTSWEGWDEEGGCQ